MTFEKVLGRYTNKNIQNPSNSDLLLLNRIKLKIKD